MLSQNYKHSYVEAINKYNILIKKYNTYIHTQYLCYSLEIYIYIYIQTLKKFPDSTTVQYVYGNEYYNNQKKKYTLLQCTCKYTSQKASLEALDSPILWLLSFRIYVMALPLQESSTSASNSLKLMHNLFLTLLHSTTLCQMHLIHVVL